jgi:hypothetical protein
MAQKTETRSVNIYINDAEASKSLEKLENKSKSLAKAIAEGQANGKKMTREMEELGKTKVRIEQLEGVISGKMRPSLQMMAQEVSKVHRELKTMSSDAPGYAAKLDEFKKKSAIFSDMKSKVAGVNEEIGGMNGKMVAAGVALGSIVSQGLMSLGSKVVDFFKDSVAEAEQAERVASRLKNILNNIGRGEAFDRLNDSAKKLAEQFQHLDNDDILEVFTQLITYGKLTEKEMNDLLPVIIDFAAQSGMNVNDSASIIIKALEGNGKALKDYGINMKEAGTVTERMKILMTELKPRVEGSALAFGETMEGQLAKAEQKFKDVKEEVGNKLIPVLTELYKGAADAITDLTKVGGFLKDVFNYGFAGANALKNIREDEYQREQEAMKGAKALVFSLDSEAKKKQGILKLTKQLTDYESNLTNARKSNNAEETARWQTMIATNKKALELLQPKGIDDKKILGLGGNMGDDKNAEKAAQEAERLRQELNKVREEMGKLEDELSLPGLSEYEQKLAKVTDRYNELEIRLIETNGTQADFDHLQKLRAKEVEQLNESYMDKLNAFLQQNEDARQQATMTAYDKEVAAINTLFDEQVKLFKGQTGALVMLEVERQERLREARLSARKDAIGFQDQAPEDNSLGARLGRFASNFGGAPGLPGVKKPKSQEEIQRDEKAQKDKWDKLKQKAQQYIQYANQAMQLIQMISSFQRAADEAEMARFRAMQAEKISNLDTLKEQKVISEEEYAKRKLDIDKETNEEERKMKRKQAESDKLAQMFQTVINTASAVVEALPNIPLSVIVGTLGAVQLGLIAATPVPEFAKGGFVPDGPSHADNGIKLVHGRTGRIIGEAEGGEPIYSKRFYQNNRPMMDAMLSYSHATNGGKMPVEWMHRPVQSINVVGINGKLQKLRYFEKGGILPGGEAGSGQPQQKAGRTSAADAQQLTNAINTLNGLLAKGIRSSVRIGDVEEQQARVDAIREMGTIQK